MARRPRLRREFHRTRPHRRSTSGRRSRRRRRSSCAVALEREGYPGSSPRQGPRTESERRLRRARDGRGPRPRQRESVRQRPEVPASRRLGPTSNRRLRDFVRSASARAVTDRRRRYLPTFVRPDDEAGDARRRLRPKSEPSKTVGLAETIGDAATQRGLQPAIDRRDSRMSFPSPSGRRPGSPRVRGAAAGRAGS